MSDNISTLTIGSVLGVKAVPGVAVGVADILDGVALFQAFTVSGQVWYGTDYRVADDQIGEWLASGYGQATYRAAAEFILLVAERLAELN